MTTDRAPKEAKDQKNRRQETQVSEDADLLQPNYANILSLQRTIGNQAVQRLVAQGRLGSQSTRIQSKPAAAEPEEAVEQEFGTSDETVLRMTDAPPSGEEAIQRDGETTGAPDTDNNPSPEKARYLAYIIKVMRNVPKIRADDKMILENLKSNSSLIDSIYERDRLVQEIYDEKLHNISDPIEQGIFAVSDTIREYLGANTKELDKLVPELAAKSARVDELNARIQAELSAQGFESETRFLQLLHMFPKIWLTQAKYIAYTMLDQNAEKIRAEQERYHVFTNLNPMRSQVTDIDRLQAADLELTELTSDLNELNQDVEMRIGRAQDFRKFISNGNPPNWEQNPDYLELKEDLDEQQHLLALRSLTLEQRFRNYTEQFPIMASQGYVPGSFYSLSYEQVEQVTGIAAQNALVNIFTTKENIADDTINVWDLRSIRELTFHELDVTEDSVLGQAVAQYIESELSDQRLFDIALGVIAFAAGLVSGPPGWITGIAAAVDIGIGIKQVLDSSDQMMAEAAAEYVAWDNDENIHDISLGEEEIIPLLMNILGVKVDVAGAISAKLVRAGWDIDDIHRVLEKGDLTLDIQNITSILGEEIGAFLTTPSDVTAETEDSEPVSYPEGDGDQAATGEMDVCDSVLSPTDDRLSTVVYGIFGKDTCDIESNLTDDASQTEDSEFVSYPEAAGR